MRRNPFLAAALANVDRGFSVFPLRPGAKSPAIADWENRATTNKRQIYAWWANNSGKNIGVVTGGPSGLLVVDLDAPARLGEPHGRQVLADLARDVGEAIPSDTRIVNTPSGGQHLYFRLPEDVELRNTAGFLGAHIDTRASGGYVVGPGSIVAKGRYRLVVAADPQPVPGWLLERLRPPAPSHRPVAPVRGARISSAYVAAAVRGEAERVATAAVGTRNHALFRAAARLGTFVAEGTLAEAEAWRVLRGAVEGHLGVDVFGITEVERTIRSGFHRATRDAGFGPHRPATAGRDGLVR